MVSRTQRNSRTREAHTKRVSLFSEKLQRIMEKHATVGSVLPEEASSSRRAFDELLQDLKDAVDAFVGRELEKRSGHVYSPGMLLSCCPAKLPRLVPSNALWKPAPRQLSAHAAVFVRSSW